MRITQLQNSFHWLHNQSLMKKYSFISANNINEPVLFFGCYGNDYIEKALSWRSKVIIWWSGSDILNLKKQPLLIEKIRNNNNIIHLATCNFIEKDLKELNLPYIKVPLFTLNSELFESKPLGDSIYVYHPNTQAYCPNILYQKIRKEFSNIPFIEADNFRTFDQDTLHKMYERSFLALRFTTHDGLSHTACEIGLMGRKIIWNGDTPNAINYKTDDDILQEIEDTIINKYCPNTISEEMFNYLNIGDDWLNI